MKARVIKIGNSKGLILNKNILDKYQIENEVNIRLEDDHLLIEPLNKPRAGWDKLFKAVKPANEEDNLMPDVFEDEELLEW